jgi:hypothetical protein
VLIEITDEGLGIPEQELAYANWRLDSPPVIDVAVSRRMGLFVVGRLAARHAIRVRLRRAGSGGLSALIWMPETVAETEPMPPLGARRLFESSSRPVGVTIPAPMAARKAKSIWFDTGYDDAPSATVAVPPAEPEPAEPEPGAAETDSGPGVRLPIYDSIESEWFRQGGASLNGDGQPPARSWTSPADEGFRAAQTVVSPTADRVTSAGLPKRVPSANLVPGSIGGQRPAAAAAVPSRSPEAMRARLKGFKVQHRDGRDGPLRGLGTDEN